MRRFLEEVPALEPIKLVVGVELRGRGDVQHFRLQMPDLKVTKDTAGDARVRVDMRREFFNVMAHEGKVADWIEAFTYGQAKASGPEQFLRLIANVVEQAAGTPANPQVPPRASAGWGGDGREGSGRSVIGRQLLCEERQRGEQKDAHHDQGEVFVHALPALLVTG